MPNKLKVWPDGESGVMFKGDSRLHVGGDIYHHDSEHAKLESANKELLNAANEAQTLLYEMARPNSDTASISSQVYWARCVQTELKLRQAIKAADEIEKE